MFNVEFKSDHYDWSRSGNFGLSKPFATRKEALAAIDPAKELISTSRQYRVVREGAAKPHTTRFIIEFFLGSEKWTRSGNAGLQGFFPTREAAQAALDAPGSHKSKRLNYRVRQK